MSTTEHNDRADAALQRAIAKQHQLAARMAALEHRRRADAAWCYFNGVVAGVMTTLLIQWFFGVIE